MKYPQLDSHHISIVIILCMQICKLRIKILIFISLMSIESNFCGHRTFQKKSNWIFLFMLQSKIFNLNRLKDAPWPVALNITIKNFSKSRLQIGFLSFLNFHFEDDLSFYSQLRFSLFLCIEHWAFVQHKIQKKMLNWLTLLWMAFLYGFIIDSSAV